MSEVTQYEPGTFCWAELATNDQQGAKKFYTTLFGWTFNDNPIGEAGTYTMLKLRQGRRGVVPNAEGAGRARDSAPLDVLRVRGLGR